MSYTRNFGFRSFENTVRDGRLKTPVGGTALNLGTPVVVDPATPGFLKQANQVTSPATAPSQLAGVVVYEHIQSQGVDPLLASPQDAPFNVAPLGRYAQIVHGQGSKIWFKNTGAKTLYDGRTQPGLTMVKNVAGLAVGDGLCPNENTDFANGYWRKAVSGTDAAWLTVESVNTTSTLVEARFNF